MRIDFHTYIGHWPFRQLRGNTPAGLVEYMGRFGIDQAVVANINGVFYKNTQPANEELALAIHSFPGRFLPYAVINPSYPDWEYDLEVCHTKLGMKGLRLYPQYHDYKLTDPRLAKLLERARGLNLPVAFSRWLVDERQQSWMDIGGQLTLDSLVPMMKDNPGTFVLLNVNVARLKDEYLAALRNVDVYFDTVYASACVPPTSGYDVLRLVKEFGSDRFLFGSGYPFRDPISALIRLEIVNELDRAAKEAIWSGNAQRLLNRRSV
jgi:predicted TIM-barrel fold metal-dependent hydrolase